MAAWRKRAVTSWPDRARVPLGARREFFSLPEWNRFLTRHTLIDSLGNHARNARKWKQPQSITSRSRSAPLSVHRRTGEGPMAELSGLAGLRRLPDKGTNE
jgi:hypothetical protein